MSHREADLLPWRFAFFPCTEEYSAWCERSRAEPVPRPPSDARVPWSKLRAVDLHQRHGSYRQERQHKTRRSSNINPTRDSTRLDHAPRPDPTGPDRTRAKSLPTVSSSHDRSQSIPKDTKYGSSKTSYRRYKAILVSRPYNELNASCRPSSRSSISVHPFVTRLTLVCHDASAPCPRPSKRGRLKTYSKTTYPKTKQLALWQEISSAFDTHMKKQIG